MGNEEVDKIVRMIKGKLAQACNECRKDSDNATTMGGKFEAGMVARGFEASICLVDEAVIEYYSELEKGEDDKK